MDSGKNSGFFKNQFVFSENPFEILKSKKNFPNHFPF